MSQINRKEGHRALLNLCAQGRYSDAAPLVDRLTDEFPAEPAFWHLKGAINTQLSRFDVAVVAFQQAISLRRDDVDAHFNLGCIYQKTGAYDQALSMFARVLEFDPRNVKAMNNLGTSCRKTGRIQEAKMMFQAALSLKSTYVDARFNLASVYAAQRMMPEAIAELQQVFDTTPSHAPAASMLLSLKGKICDFDAYRDFRSVGETLGISTSSVSPFGMLHFEDVPKQHKLRARKWVHETYSHAQPALPLKPPRDKIRIGYVSASLGIHPIRFLTAGLFRTHDRDQFEIFVYDAHPSKTDPLKATPWMDGIAVVEVQDLDDATLTELIQSHALDFAIDLDGHTKNARLEVFARRIAPLQVTYLGFPGTSGASFFDYMVADHHVIDPAQRTHYDESIMYLPDTYQATDNQREIAQTTKTRADFGLPVNAFVFCCFNNSAKIDPRAFDIWMRVMNQVEDSVLWLLQSNDVVHHNLRKEAEARGVSGGRLFFAEKIPQAEHLERHKHADLFIDTFNYNAHTTASDALWAGLPVLTKQGRQFAARVAGSLLHAAGLPELITQTEDAYETLMTALATDRDRMAALRVKLAKTRDHCALFDTARFTQVFERGLVHMLNRARAGHQPVDFDAG